MIYIRTNRHSNILVLIVVSLFSIITQPVYALSQVAPSVSFPVLEDSNYGATGIQEYIELSNLDRIRQNGTITQLKFRVNDTTKLAIFNYTIWRKNDTGAPLYDRISVTNISNIQTVVNGDNIVNVNIPVQEGDYYGFSLKVIGAGYVTPLKASSVGHVTNYTGAIINDTAAIGYNWAQSTLVSGYVIEAYMDDTYASFIGDSIISGYPDHHGFMEPTKLTNISNTTENHWFVKVNSTDLFTSYQNMGYGGQTTTQIRSRIVNDVVNKSPQFAVIEGGVNDVSGGVITDATILDNWEYNINKTYYSGITPVIILILPWTGGSNAQNQRIDDLNTEIQRIALNYTPNIIVDARCDVGQFRAGGDAGNCWDIKPAYRAPVGDNIHYSSAGYDQLAFKIRNSSHDIYANSSLVNYINSSGWIVYSRTLNSSRKTNASIIPSSDSVSVTVTTWNINGKKAWTENSSNHSVTTQHQIGDFPANTNVELFIDSVSQGYMISNSTGWVSFDYVGGFSEHDFEIDIVSLATVTASNTCNSLVNYESTTVSIFGLALMVLGFGGVIFALRGINGGLIMPAIIIIIIGFSTIIFGNYVVFTFAELTC